MEAVDRRMMLAGAGLLGVGALARLAEAGTLTPPAGPVSPTGRTLGEIYDRIARTDVGLAEPRIPVQSLPGSDTALHVIHQPGSYYLTSNIVGQADKDGIEIAADQVSLDLCGFSLAGGPGTLSGIRVTGNRLGLQVRNGVVVGWEQEAIQATAAAGSVIRDVHAYGGTFGVGPGGIGIAVGPDSWISDVLVRGKGAGFFTDNGAFLRSCAAVRCESGFFLRRAQVIDCLALGNNGKGFYVEQAGLIDRCEARENNGEGILVFGHVGTLVRNCNCISNLASGITVLFCSDVSVLECNLSRNTGAGVLVDQGRAVRIEGNNSSNNAFGIRLLEASQACVVLRNTLSTNGIAFENSGANAYGPIVNVTGAGDIAGISGANHPWANFSY